MPGWQSFYEAHQEQVEVVSIANDIQGAKVAKPWLEKANATYRSLLDQHNQIGKSFTVKFVPLGILVDEEGRLVRSVGSVNIQEEAFRSDLTSWVESGQIPQAWLEEQGKHEIPGELSSDEQEADARLQLAVALLEKGKKAEAIAELRTAFRLDLQNWLIRKQLWAIENPGAFYEGDVDYSWQKEQIAREDVELVGVK